MLKKIKLLLYLPLVHALDLLLKFAWARRYLYSPRVLDMFIKANSELLLEPPIQLQKMSIQSRDLKLFYSNQGASLNGVMIPSILNIIDPKGKFLVLLDNIGIIAYGRNRHSQIKSRKPR